LIWTETTRLCHRRAKAGWLNASYYAGVLHTCQQFLIAEHTQISNLLAAAENFGTVLTCPPAKVLAQQESAKRGKSPSLLFNCGPERSGPHRRSAQNRARILIRPPHE
jgi:hypothetical protein